VPGSFDGLRHACTQAVAEGAVSGLVVAIGAGGRTVFAEAFGNRQTEPEPRPATVDTVYDLASLTKPLVTSLLVLRAVATGRWSLDDPLRDTRPGTVRQALAHTAGLPAHRPFYAGLNPEKNTRSAELRARLVALAAEEPETYKPGTRSQYSDLGFILLGDRLEKSLGARLDVLATREIFGPLGIFSPGFVDLTTQDAPFGGRLVAPTERCPVRGRMMEGEVHDLNAHVMGGVAGHAGLFGSVEDVACLAHALCAAWRGTPPAGVGQPLCDSHLLRAFWAPAGVPGSTWRLGWDGPSARGSLAGERLHRRAVGHLAFTGCSLWIDPERETFVTVLTNRIHPTVETDRPWRRLRPVLNDTALDAIGYRAE
jgi:CubicO group peptidase (beta-lactamase class C family)